MSSKLSGTVFPSLDGAIEMIGKSLIKRIEIDVHTYQQLQDGLEVEGFQFCPRTVDFVDGHYRDVPVVVGKLERDEYALILQSKEEPKPKEPSKLKGRVLLTVGGYRDWQEYVFWADSQEELRTSIESLLEEGYGLNDINFWEPYKLHSRTPPKGEYLVMLSRSDDEPIEVYASGTSDMAHSLVSRAREDLAHDDAESKPTVWREVKFDVHTAPAVREVTRRN